MQKYIFSCNINSLYSRGLYSNIVIQWSAEAAFLRSGRSKIIWGAWKFQQLRKWRNTKSAVSNFRTERTNLFKVKVGKQKIQFEGWTILNHGRLRQRKAHYFLYTVVCFGDSDWLHTRYNVASYQSNCFWRNSSQQ